MKKIITLLSFMYFPMMVNGCAFNVISVEQVPTNLTTNISCNDSFVLAQDINIKLVLWYNRTLKKGTRWDCIGQIPQGNVYKTKDQILTIEASNTFEAYIVVLFDKIVGFYLPVESTFSPLDTRAKLVLTQAISDPNINQ